ncbi:ketopantoate reductase family protein [Thalassospira mesophila]|uniref:2-dehydropantoate 2-reductase n=1 Tax=Thalassospira mesophila TaxID=1293891 RepID=A0A1Y2L7P8_9PROT|nr:2-dehydropantoate 2-reductase [Thalassospira mesophila]OSQ40849.1 2-dehydropantoate 2-reductase [Thalassospira mesophila]
MKIAVMGAGAVGCYYGAKLAQHGYDVVLIGRPQHVRAINKNGLHFESGGTSTMIALAASIDPAAVAGADIVLFCVKSTDTASAGAAIAPHLGAHTVVMSLQNGVDNAERLGAIIGRSVVPTVVYVGAGMAGDGHVAHFGRGDLVIGPNDASDMIAQTLRPAGIPVEISKNAQGALWAKMILNCAYNALSAVSRLPYGDLAKGEGVMVVIENVVAECLGVAGALGIIVPGDVREAVAGIIKTMPAQYSSTAQDLMRGKPSEIDYLNGYIVRKGGEMGVATPANQVLYTMVKLLEMQPEQTVQG